MASVMQQQQRSTKRFLGHLTNASINPAVKKAQYAVRGQVVLRADELNRQLAKPDHGLPFDKMYFCNIGNPQALGQKPLTFVRQVLSGCLNPDLLDQDGVLPGDVVTRCRTLLKGTSHGSIGAYTHSQGLEPVRESIANFLESRDGGVKADPNNIFLTDGASPGIKQVLQAVISDESDGVLIPIPQYPLYSASIALCGGSQVGYELDESRGWAFDVEQARKTCADARQRGVTPKILVVINPNNPTGNCFQPDNMADIARLCRDENLLLIADEVYQENVYASDRKFHSFKKILANLGSDFSSVELCSFHSTSKGIMGECGLRGGYMELTNVADEGRDELYKLASINLCPNTTGQLATEVMVHPPAEGDESYALYRQEYDTLTESLTRRAHAVSKALNSIDGMSCQPIEGAMYAFPSIELSKSAIAAAEAAGHQPDTFYVLQLLEQTGICVVPGSGFLQKSGTWHFRTTLLPPEEQIADVVSKLAAFHKNFSEKYA